MRYLGSLLLTMLWAGPALYGQAPVQHRALVHESEAWMTGPPLDHVARWNGTLLASCDPCISREPILFTVDRQGRRDEIVFTLPDSGYVRVDGIGSGPDGALAVVGYSMSDDSRIASYIAWISPDRKRQVVNRTWPFYGYSVTVAPDGTIWAVGPIKVGTEGYDLEPNVLRHYDPSGRLLASVTVKARPFLASAEVAAVSSLMASRDRIGWLTNGCEYIEFSFDAKELGRYNCPSGIVSRHDTQGVALSANNDVVLGLKPSSSFAPVELNRAKGTWDPVPVPADAARSWHYILGFDGLSLVTFPGRGELRRFTWGEAPQAAGNR